MASGSDLIRAARAGNLHDVERLLQEGADINATDERYGQTAISWAAEKGHLDVVKALHRAHADVQIGDHNGRCPVDWAVQSNEAAVVSFFLQVAGEKEASHRYFKGRGLLSVAAEHGSIEDVDRLAKLGSVDQRDKGGVTPLMVAIQSGRSADHVVVLLNAGADPLQKDEDQHTAFYWAAEKGDIETIRLLTDARPDPVVGDPLLNQEGILLAFAATADEEKWKAFLNAQPGRGVKMEGDRTSTALHFAAQHGFQQAVERILASDNSDMNARDANGRTPLIWASVAGHVAIVEALLRYNASTTLSDEEYNETALMWAAECGHDQVVGRLCKDKVDRNDANVRGYNGYTALTFAAINGNAASVSALIKAGADLNVLDDRWGQSPLSWAAEGQHLEAVKALIRAGADLYTESRGKSPVSFALDYLTILQPFIEEAREDTRDGGEKVPRVRVIELALRHSCNENDNPSSDSSSDSSSPALSKNLGFVLGQKEYLEAVDHEGRSLVSWAAQGGSRKEMEVLFGTEQLDFNLKDTNGLTPLHWAAESGNSEVVLWLLALQDVVVDESDGVGRTPLSRAAAKGHYEVMDNLLMKGAASNSQDRDERTVLSWAAGGGHDLCVRLLLDHKADPDSPNRNRRTPLSLAAEKGHADVVNLLLSLRDGKARTEEGLVNRNMKGQEFGAREGGVGKKDKAGAVNKESTGRTGAKNGGAVVLVDFKDVDQRTPLWYAVTGYHLAVSKTLRLNGASPAVMDKSQRSLQQILDDRKNAGGLEAQAMAALDATLEQLRSAQALLSEPLGGAADADREFEATILRVPENEKLDLDTKFQPVNKLLAEGLPEPQGVSCAWMHLPANNVSTYPPPSYHDLKIC